MSGQAGYDIGQEIAKMLEHVFVSRLAKIIAKTGHFLGIFLLAGGVLVMILDSGMEVFDGELVLAGFLTGVGGVVLLLVLHWIALQIDKKHIDRKNKQGG